MDYHVNECMDLPEINNDLLMELLDDTKKDESLALMVNSLEEENNCADQLPSFSNACALLNLDLIHTHEDCEDCSLDDMLSSLDGHKCSLSSTYIIDDLLEWVEMDMSMDSPISVIDDHLWQLEGIGCNSFYNATGEYVEKRFCPLLE